jgi:hypothetical protein
MPSAGQTGAGTDSKAIRHGSTIAAGKVRIQPPGIDISTRSASIRMAAAR